MSLFNFLRYCKTDDVIRCVCRDFRDEVGIIRHCRLWTNVSVLILNLAGDIATHFLTNIAFCEREASKNVFLLMAFISMAIGALNMS